MSQFITEPVTLESDTSADELSQDLSQGSSLSYKRLKKELEKRSYNLDLKIQQEELSWS